MVIPIAVRNDLTARLERHRREHFPESETLVVHCRGDLAYVTRHLGDGETQPMFRLSWKGLPDDWDFAMWSDPERAYVAATLPNGDASGTPEVALRRAYEARASAAGKLVAPPTNRWSPSAPVAPEDHWMRPYIRAVRAHPLFVVLFVLGAVLGSLVIIAQRSPTYTARARLLITPVERGEAGDPGLPLLQEHGDPTRTIETAAAVVEKREIAAKAADDLGVGWTAAQVLDAIDVAPQGQTNVLEVRATAHDAETASAVANAYADAVIRVRDDALRDSADEAIAAIMADLDGSDAMSSSTVRTLESRRSELELMRVTGDPTVAVMEDAEVPTSADGSPSIILVIAALMVGVVLAPGAALIVDRLGPRRLMSEAEVVEVYPLAILAHVPLRPSLPTSEGTNSEARDAFRRLRAKIQLVEPRPRTIMITSPSEGNRRTSTALNLAAELADSGAANVVLIDLDTRLVLAAAQTGLVEEAGQVAGLYRYRLPATRSLLVLSGRDLAEETSAVDVVDAALEAIRVTADVADYVVLHAPPVGEMIDALRLAATTDALILVVRLGSITRASLEAARTQLASIGIPPTGYVVVS